MAIQHGLPFAEYQKLPGINASLLKHAKKSWKQFQWVRDNGYTPKTDVTVGNAMHTLVELLPVERFQDVFVVMPDFARSHENVDAKGNPSSSAGTKWVRERKAEFEAENEGRMLSQIDYKRVLRMLEALEANPLAMQVIGYAQSGLSFCGREVTVTADSCGVECKGRIDGIWGGGIWDLKTSANIAPHRFGKTAADLGYLFQLAFYWRLLAANGIEPSKVDIIAVQDPKPRIDGGWNDAPDCCVYSVPLVAIENQFSEIDRLLDEYRECETTGVWPGCPDGELVVPNWAMGEQELVD